ncbi:UDP-galactose-lipid carrier transferase [Metabacillus sp. KIGAM252]|uniref:UDP-galactose-lipid carrier transferase n=1 Tax=Metabacillus flavus TaxID=2823519 RepID=A0ABS5LAK7_9BACI|nr:UDP-galactose-lipid carrier transferase [Metabacillus flavus]MBS2967671.1 UDP-galactose-lipid carrier transferase [Metabacillus flavus]
MLDTIDLSQTISDKEYKSELKALQLKLLGLQRALVEHKIGCVLVFEGWDAAGKGGSIKRIAEGLDPRGYNVHPVSAPTQEEKDRHYLHRFWTNMPKKGGITIFDRSWYGRVLVERVEKFAAEKEWMRAFEQINQFEKLMTDEDFIVQKFWFHISKDEQLKRFKEREKNPLKKWKITDEDWRNREKWEDYVPAVEEMLKRTNTDEAPWHVVEGEDKKFARVKTLQLVTQAMEMKAAEKGISLKDYL